LYGQPAQLGAIRALARRYGVPVLEDAAQAHGARYCGARVGTDSDVVAWSFYPGKNLGALGDGGALTTDDDSLADRLRLLRNYGSRVKYRHDERGLNSRLDELQAAVLRVKLPLLDAWNARRSAAAGRYSRELAGTNLLLPQVPSWCDPAWHLYVIRSPRRDALRDHLASRGIGSLIHYPTPPHNQRAYADAGFAPHAFPIASAIAGDVLSLPLGPHLLPEQQDAVIEAIHAFPGIS
jgi:dTDP-4-amino-4,6-dideoxygalactose transaminase